MDADDDIYRAIFDAFPTLGHAARFAHLIPNVRWFSALSTPLSGKVYELSLRYLEELGVPDAYPALVGDWEDALGAVENPDVNSLAWDAEEQLRVTLDDELAELLPEDAREPLFLHIASVSSQVVTHAAKEAALYLGIQDDAFVEILATSGIQACHMAALALAARGGEDHCFITRFRLFECGRWPLGIVGNSFNIF